MPYSGMPVRHLYVHVPFCARRCSYCDFSIAVRAATPVDEYLTALRIEADRVIAPGSTLDTVYLGGGTPSRLGGAGVAAVLATVRERASIAPDAELTIEANPDDVTAEAATTWRAAGVNRVSLGAQSFDDHVLRWMHRTHDAAQTGIAVSILRDSGIDNISLDLIFSLPEHLNRSWESDVVRALSLRPAHVSLYGLTVEPRTPIGRWADRGTVVEGTEAQYEAEFLYAHDTLSAAGFNHYEVSNFALPTRASRHNSAYWSGVPYAALGPSAHSFDGVSRRWNVSAYTHWLNLLASGQSAVAGEDRLTPENQDAENVYLGLRTTRGLVLDEVQLDAARPWVQAGWAEIEGQRVRLTASGWLRLDSIAAAIAAGQARAVCLDSPLVSA